MGFVERADFLDEGSDGFFFGSNELLHAFVPYQEIGGGDIFVDEEEFRAGL